MTLSSGVLRIFFVFFILPNDARKGRADLTKLINSQKDHSLFQSRRGSNIDSNLQKRDRTARDEDGFVFLAPASTSSTSRRRAYASGMRRLDCIHSVSNLRRDIRASNFEWRAFASSHMCREIYFLNVLKVSYDRVFKLCFNFKRVSLISISRYKMKNNKTLTICLFTKKKKKKKQQITKRRSCMKGSARFPRHPVYAAASRDVCARNERKKKDILASDSLRVPAQMDINCRGH